MGAFSFWSKDAGVLIEVAGGKEAGKGKYAISYMCEWYYNVNPPSSYKRRGMNNHIYISNVVIIRILYTSYNI